MVGVKGSGRCHVPQRVGNWDVWPVFRVPSALAGLGLELGSISPPAPCLRVPCPFGFTTFPAHSAPLHQHQLQQHVFSPFTSGWSHAGLRWPQLGNPVCY